MLRIQGKKIQSTKILKIKIKNSKIWQFVTKVDPHEPKNLIFC